MIIGVSVRVSLCGQIHPWKVIADEGGAETIVMISLPEGLNWLNEPCDPVMGSLMTGTSPELSQKALEALSLKNEILVHHDHRNMEIFKNINVNYIEAEIDTDIHDQSYAEIMAIKKERGKNESN